MNTFSIAEIDWSLYAILDKQALGNRSAAEVAEAVIAGGAGVIQMRNKSADVQQFYEDVLAVRKVTRAHNIPLIVNDRVDVAKAAKADGVHLGQDDLPVPVARGLLGEDAIIGVSVHDETEFKNCVADKPNYLGVGTIYASPSKDTGKISGLDLLAKLRSKTSLPIVAIGGINKGNCEPAITAGANGVAVISALLASENILGEAAALARAIKLSGVQQNSEQLS